MSLGKRDYVNWACRNRNIEQEIPIPWSLFTNDSWTTLMMFQPYFSYKCPWSDLNKKQKHIIAAWQSQFSIKILSSQNISPLYSDIKNTNQIKTFLRPPSYMLWINARG